jgi:KRAB domain-containing zinc finger protein
MFIIIFQYGNQWILRGPFNDNTATGMGITCTSIRKPSNTPSQCGICNKIFPTNFRLKIHTRIHTGEKPFACDICGRRFSQKSHVKPHRMTHTGEKPIVCDECGQCFRRWGRLRRHKQDIHSGEKKDKCESGTREGEATHDETETLLEGDITEGIEASHKKEGTLETEKPGVCEIEVLKKCVTEHRCGICGKKFSAASMLKIHMRSHTGEKPYECEVCGSHFRQKSHLKQHRMTHTGEKPIVCDECGQRFAGKNRLRRHKLNIHSDEKPYVCDTCGKAFADNGNLKQHKIIHTGEKPYQCSVCGKSFNQSSVLRRHMLIHSKEENTTTSDFGE